MRARQDGREPLIHGGSGNVQGQVGADPARLRQALGGAPDDDDVRRAAQLGKDGRVEAHRSAALHDDGIPQGDLGALERVHRRRQATPRTDEPLRRHFAGQRQDLDAGFQVDHLRPAAEETLVSGIGDAVHAPVRAARGGLGHRAVPTLPARLVHVQKGDDLTDAKRLAVQIDRCPADLRDLANVHVSRDQWVRDAAQPPVMKMHIRAAHFAVQRAQEHSPFVQRRHGELADLDGHLRTGHDRRSDHSALRLGLGYWQCFAVIIGGAGAYGNAPALYVRFTPDLRRVPPGRTPERLYSLRSISQVGRPWPAREPERELASAGWRHCWLLMMTRTCSRR